LYAINKVARRFVTIDMMRTQFCVMRKILSDIINMVCIVEEVSIITDVDTSV
jgi:hypothetical protein